jgi:hypothetical protein
MAGSTTTRGNTTGSTDNTRKSNAEPGVCSVRPQAMTKD